MGLDRLGTNESKEMAYNWAARYTRSNFIGCYNHNNKFMYEKVGATYYIFELQLFTFVCKFFFSTQL